LTQKPWALQLARELGLDDQLLGTNDHKRTVYVLNKGKPVPLPEGVLLIVPTKFMPFALSPLISLRGKIRMGMDLFIPPRNGSADETLADFVRRRLGHEALDKIAEPLMAGIYNAEAERQSLMATFPRFRKLEQDYGSLIRGMLAARKARSKPPNNMGKKPVSVFMSLQAGSEELIRALVAQLTGELKINTGVTHIDSNLKGDYSLQLSTGEVMRADAVIVATPAYAAAALLRPLVPRIADALDAIRYVSTGTISLAYRRGDIQRPLEGFGLVIPHSENRPINAITLSSIKFDHRAPDGHVLMRAFFGGSRSPQSMALDDDVLLTVVRKELKAILGIEAPPLFRRIYRWHRANPQYDVGHLDRVDAIDDALPDGIFVTGSPYRGVGMPDCVHQAQQTATRVVTQIKNRVPSQ
jgi:oxygen-dependent protoporphyrinogen oxidase